MTRSNAGDLERDKAKIAARLLAGEPMRNIIEEYHVGWLALGKFCKRNLTWRQRKAMKKVRHAGLAESGAAHRFKPGHVPANKGKKGWCPEGCKKSWFKKGEMHGAAQCNYHEIGTIVVRRDHGNKVGKNKRLGKLRHWIKIKDDGRPQDRHITLARFVWEQEHGPIAAGACIMHADGDSMNDDPGNLLLVADARARLKRQRETIPGMEARRIKSAVNGRRKARAKAKREAAKLERQAKREAAKLERQAKRESRERKRHARAHAEAIEENKNRALVTEFETGCNARGRATAIGTGVAAAFWLCAACGYTSETTARPDRCIKCGSYRFEQLAERVAV